MPRMITIRGKTCFLLENNGKGENRGLDSEQKAKFD